MTRCETSFKTDGDLIVVPATAAGMRGRVPGRFVLDTGCALTTMIPEVADELGYSARDAVRRSRVQTAVGAEDGYVLRVAEFSALGFSLPSFLVNVFDLGHDIDGLLGMNFLSRFNYEVRSDERRIFVERLAR